MEGYISIHRKIFDNEFYFLEKFTFASAWIDLLLLANYKDGSILVRGNLIPIKRGQVGWSEVALAKRWKWSRDKVRRYLTRLSDSGQIIQQKNFVSTVLTIVNYDKYQACNTAEKQQTRQQTDSRQDTNNKVNKENKIYTRKFFIEHKEELLKEAEEKYPDKDCLKAIENFIAKTGAKDYKYKNYKLAFFNWVREDKFNEYKKTSNFYINRG